jgi:very-short-patch-repair endonuclease
LTTLGWRVIHVTWTDLERRPAEIIKSIQKTLAERASPAKEI